MAGMEARSNSTHDRRLALWERLHPLGVRKLSLKRELGESSKQTFYLLWSLAGFQPGQVESTKYALAHLRCCDIRCVEGHLANLVARKLIRFTDAARNEPIVFTLGEPGEYVRVAADVDDDQALLFDRGARSEEESGVLAQEPPMVAGSIEVGGSCAETPDLGQSIAEAIAEEHVGGKSPKLFSGVSYRVEGQHVVVVAPSEFVKTPSTNRVCECRFGLLSPRHCRRHYARLGSRRGPSGCQFGCGGERAGGSCARTPGSRLAGRTGANVNVNINIPLPLTLKSLGKRIFIFKVFRRARF